MFPQPSRTHSGNAELKRRVENFLATRAHANLKALDVTVHGGKVLLSGRVSSPLEKRLAGSCAQRVAGVLEVINEIAVAMPRPIESDMPTDA